MQKAIGVFSLVILHIVRLIKCITKESYVLKKVCIWFIDETDHLAEKGSQDDNDDNCGIERTQTYIDGSYQGISKNIVDQGAIAQEPSSLEAEHDV